MSVSSIQSDSFCHFWTAITGVGGSEVPNPISHKTAHCCCTLLEPEEPGNKSANFWVGFQGSAKHLPEGVWRAGLVMIATNGSPSPVRKCSPAKLWPLDPIDMGDLNSAYIMLQYTTSVAFALGKNSRITARSSFLGEDGVKCQAKVARGSK